MIRIPICLSMVAGVLLAQAPSTPKADPLWAGGAPGAQGTQDEDMPTLAPYIVPQGKGTGTAVIVCPGGSYVHLSMDKEGDQVVPIDRLSSRPDFLVLVYAVISFKPPYVHRGSLQALLGDQPDPKLVENLSNELQVTAETPPTFLFHTSGDRTVPAENSALFYLALRKAGVPAEMHIYEQGPHGVGLAQTDEALSSWPGRLADWLRGRGLLNSDGK